MNLHLKLELPFRNELLFSGFLPESETDALNLSINEGQFRATIYMTDRKGQLNHIGDVPLDPKELQRHMTLGCVGLTMNLTIIDVSQNLIDALRASVPTEETEAFGRDVFKIVLDIQNQIIIFCRDVMKQYWLEPLDINPENYQSFLNERKAVWLDADGNWRRFTVVRQNVVHLSLRLLGDGINRDSWLAIQTFIEKGQYASMRDVLLANCLKHLDQRNGRLAVVEAVITLEAAIKQLLPKVILKLPGTPQIDERMIDRLVERAGLRSAVEVGLSLIQVAAGLETNDIQLAVKAVEVRNEVIHSSRRTVDVATAQKYVYAIKKIIETFEQWANSKQG